MIEIYYLDSSYTIRRSMLPLGTLIESSKLKLKKSNKLKRPMKLLDYLNSKRKMEKGRNLIRRIFHRQMALIARVKFHKVLWVSMLML